MILDIQPTRMDTDNIIRRYNPYRVDVEPRGFGKRNIPKRSMFGARNVVGLVPEPDLMRGGSSLYDFCRVLEINAPFIGSRTQLGLLHPGGATWC